MSPKPKERVQLLIEPQAKLQLRSYAKYRGCTLTQLIEDFGHLCERTVQEALTPEDFEAYRHGNLRREVLRTVP